MNNTIGETIRNLRKENGITMKELAKEVNVTEQAISQYERGVRMPNFEILEKIFVTFNKKISEELKNDPYIKPLEVLYILINQINTGGMSCLNSIEEIIYPNLNVFKKIFTEDDLNILIGSLNISDSLKNYIEESDIKQSEFYKRTLESLINNFKFFEIPKNKKITITLEDI